MITIPHVSCALLLISMLTTTSGSGYGCTTVYEEVSVVKQVPKVTKECATVTNKKCKTVFKTSTTTKLETQCSAAYDTVCKPGTDTGFKQDCVTVQDEECHVVFKEGKYGKHDPRKICSTVPKQKCSSVPTSVSSPRCINIPTQKCAGVPVTAPVQVPVQTCQPVPRRVCQNVVSLQGQVDTVSVPREVCGGSTGTGGGGGSGFGGIGGGSGFGSGNAGSSSSGSYGGHRRQGNKQDVPADQEKENKLETIFGFEDENIFSGDNQIEFSPSPFDVPFKAGKLRGNKKNSKYQVKEVLKDYLKTPIYRQKRKSSPSKEVKHAYQTSFT